MLSSADARALARALALQALEPAEADKARRQLAAAPETGPLKANPEDDEIAAQIARASEFGVHLLLGPFNRHKRFPLESYKAAIEAADELDALSQYGRRSVIYAVNSLGSFPVTPRLAVLAGLI